MSPGAISQPNEGEPVVPPEGESMFERILWIIFLILAIIWLVVELLGKLG
jgi:flagellar biogenesis protein FliO